MANKVILKDLFGALQKQMEAQLSTNREFIEHPTSKGDSLENTWIDWLRKYLPNRYCVDKAIVIDSAGNLSEQIDLVIYDQQYTPFILTQNGIHYIPAEGVYAVFEVKPDLKGGIKVGKKSLSYIEYAGRKIESVRRLKRTSTYIVDRGETKNPRPLTKILGGILTSTNTIAKEDTLKRHVFALSGLRGIDMGCAVDYASFYVEYDGKEDAGIETLQDRIVDYYEKRMFKGIEFSQKGNSLVTFFFQLSRYLQQSIGTVAAIDLSEYAKAVNFDIDEVL